MASVHSVEEIIDESFNPLSRVHQRYRQTTDDRRQTIDRQTDRQTDDRRIYDSKDPNVT